MATQEPDSAGAQPDAYEVPDDLERELAGWPDPLNRLRAALRQNELVLYGQPIVDLRSGGHPPMAETLVRLKEEEEALLPPGDFFPAFEHYRMMPELDRWVLGKALSHLFHGSHIPRVTINVSTQSLADSSFTRFIAEAAMASALPASSLVFEIDEAAILDHLETAARFAASVRAIGCGVLIDGFGGKGVSFTPLKSLRVDFLKVDGGIIRNIGRSPVAQTKLEAIVRVSKTVGFELIAEGVEDEQILARLSVMGVHYAQGYGVSPPLPMETLLNKDHQADGMAPNSKDGTDLDTLD